MLFVFILNLIVFLQLGSSIYSFIDVKDSNFVNDDSEKTRNLSLTSLIVLSILIILINSFYIFNIINEKRTILNIILLALVSSVFIFTNYIYLNNQKTIHPGYNTAKQNLINNSENINKNLKDYNFIVGVITVVCSSLILCFFIGYHFFSRVEIKKVKEAVIIEEKPPKKFNKFVKLNLDFFND